MPKTLTLFSVKAVDVHSNVHDFGDKVYITLQPFNLLCLYETHSIAQRHPYVSETVQI